MNKILLTLVLAMLNYSALWSQSKLSSSDLKRMEQAKNGVMEVLLTTNAKDSLLLRTKSEAVDLKDENYKKLAQLLLATVTDSSQDGVGIAAPQVGINKRMFLIQRFDKDALPFQVIINPSIHWTSNLIQSGKEGCLSIPNVMGMVDRYYAIDVHYQDLEGYWHNEILEGFTAIIFQHEFDHLNGVLFIDRLIEQAQKKYIQPTQPYKWLSDKNTR